MGSRLNMNWDEKYLVPLSWRKGLWDGYTLEFLFPEIKFEKLCELRVSCSKYDIENF